MEVCPTLSQNAHRQLTATPAQSTDTESLIMLLKYMEKNRDAVTDNLPATHIQSTATEPCPGPLVTET